MKAPDFEYHRPETLDAALALLANGEAMPLAGGQSLMPMMNFRVSAPDALVDLNTIDGLAGISVDGDTLRIGAMTRYAALQASSEVAEHAPLIARALPFIAHSAIRNRGTIGGSCALADPAAEMPAVLLALGGEVEVTGTEGARRIAADDFFLGLYDTACREEELVTQVSVPVAGAQRFGFNEVARRHGDYAMAGCVIAASENLATVRVAFFGVADRAVRSPGAEAALAGGYVDAAVSALGDIDFAGDANANEATKRHLAGVVLKRAWAEVVA